MADNPFETDEQPYNPFATDEEVPTPKAGANHPAPAPLPQVLGGGRAAPAPAPLPQVVRAAPAPAPAPAPNMPAPLPQVLGGGRAPPAPAPAPAQGSADSADEAPPPVKKKKLPAPAPAPAPASHSQLGQAVVAMEDRNRDALARETAALQERERAVAAREAALNERSRALDVREANVGEDPRKPNWPRCRPMIYHNIAEDIPPEVRSVCKQAYIGWYLMTWCLLFNFFALLVVLCEPYAGGGDKGLAFAIGTVYMVLGIPLAFRTWYLQLYDALKRQKARLFVAFFCMFTIHCLFVTYEIIGVQDSGSAGLLTAYNAFSFEKTFSASVCLISAIFWFINTIWSLVLFKRVHKIYKGRGLTLSGAQGELIGDLAKSNAGRAALMQAAKSAV